MMSPTLMPLRRTLLSLSLAALASAAPIGAARAQSTGCPGKNILDEIKASDPAATARINLAIGASKNGKTLLWKIESEEKADHPPSYLFGTLDVSDERLRKFSTAVVNAMSTSSRIALEVDDTSPERTQEALTVMQDALFPPTTPRLDVILGKPEIAHANLLLAPLGLPPDVQPRIKPWVAMLLTSMSDCERRRQKQGKLSLDAELAHEAENRGIGSFGVESTEMKLSALSALPDEAQVSLLKASLAAHDRIDDVNEAMISLYLTREFGALWPLQAEVARRYGADPKALEAYRESVLEARNLRMRDRTLMHLAIGGVFVAVGAMHLPGDKGLVELFKEQGYTLTPLE